MKKIKKRNIKQTKNNKLNNDSSNNWNELKKDYSFNFKTNDKKIDDIKKIDEIKENKNKTSSVDRFSKRYIHNFKRKDKNQSEIKDHVNYQNVDNFNSNSKSTSSVLYEKNNKNNIEDNSYSYMNSQSEKNNPNYYKTSSSNNKENNYNANSNYNNDNSYNYSLTDDDKLRYERYRSDLKNNPYYKGKTTGSNITKMASRKSMGFTKYLTREMIIENQQEDSLRSMRQSAYKGFTRGKLAYNVGGRIVDMSAVTLALPFSLYSKKIKNKDNLKSNLNSVNYRFVRHRSVANLEKSISENKVGELYSNKELWKRYLKDNKLGIITLNNGKLKLNKFNRKDNADYLFKKRAIKKYKLENKILKKRLARKKNINQLTKIVAFDNIRRFSNQVSSDNQNLGLSGFDAASDIYRDSFKFTKYTSKGGLKASGKTLKATSRVAKGGYKEFKKIPQKHFTFKKHFNKYKKIYKENNFKTAFKTAFKDLVRNIVSTFKRVIVMLFSLIKSAIIYALGLLSSIVIPSAMIIAFVFVCIFGITRIYPMTIVNSFDSIADEDGEDIKDMFDCVREWNGEFETYGDIVVYEGNPDNSKALISITSRYFDNDLKNRQKVYDYLAYLHDISHVVTIEYIEVPDDTVNSNETDEIPTKILKKVTVKTEEDFKEIINSIKDGSASTKDDTDHLENGMRMIKDNYINKKLGSDSLAGGSYEDTSGNASTNVQEAFANITKEKNLTASEINQWKYIISHESGWNVTATNPSSGAYGLGQAYPAEKMASYGSDYRTNPTTQLRWMYDYMLQAYGSVTNAYNFWVKNHWY